MDAMLKNSLWLQYGAALDMLHDAVRLCPNELWTAALWRNSRNAAYGQFWYIAYHTLFYVDLYLKGTFDDFAPPPPFKRGRLPKTPYTKDQIYTYLDQCRSKCRETLEALTDEKARQRCTFNWIDTNFLELQIYSLRHVQEHAAQLNLFLGQHEIEDIDWVTQARDKIPS